jgi:hypothetical protein
MKLFILALGALALAAATASTLIAADTLPPNHHVHDCTQAPCTYPHLGASFFPSVLGQTTAQYVLDPAVCPDATDKSLLPQGRQENQTLRAGQCSTTTTIIHLRSIPEGDAVPEGWSIVTHPGGTSVDEGVTYRTYYRLTPR